MNLINKLTQKYRSFFTEKESRYSLLVENMNTSSKNIEVFIKEEIQKNKDQLGFDKNLVIANVLSELGFIDKSCSIGQNDDISKINSYLLTSKLFSFEKDYNFLLDKLNNEKIINCLDSSTMYDQSQSANHFYTAIKTNDGDGLYIISNEKGFVFFKDKKGIHIRFCSRKQIVDIVSYGFRQNFLFKDLSGFDEGFILSANIYEELHVPTSEFYNRMFFEQALFNVHSGACSAEIELT
jgi:hypothetical protein